MTVSDMKSLLARLEDEGHGELEIALDLDRVREKWWGQLSHKDPRITSAGMVDFKVLPLGQKE